MSKKQAKSKGCWRYESIGYFHKDCATTLPTWDGDRRDKLISGTSPTIDHISHTITVSNPITYFIF